MGRAALDVALRIMAQIDGAGGAAVKGEAP
jgi:hypothetical protein